MSENTGGENGLWALNLKQVFLWEIPISKSHSDCCVLYWKATSESCLKFVSIYLI